MSKLEKELAEFFGKVGAYDLSYSEAGEISGLRIAKVIIKKAFEGVVND